MISKYDLSTYGMLKSINTIGYANTVSYLLKVLNPSLSDIIFDKIDNLAGRELINYIPKNTDKEDGTYHCNITQLGYEAIVKGNKEYELLSVLMTINSVDFNDINHTVPEIINRLSCKGRLIRKEMYNNLGYKFKLTFNGKLRLKYLEDKYMHNNMHIQDLNKNYLFILSTVCSKEYRQVLDILELIIPYKLLHKAIENAVKGEFKNDRH